MINNPIRSLYDSNLGADNFAKSLGRINKIQNISITTSAIVLEVDRRGGRFIIDRAGADGGNDLYSPIFTLRVRLLTNFYNSSDGEDRSQFDGDEIYCIPGTGFNIIEIPEPGDVVRVQFNKPFSQDSKGIAYWLGRESWYMTVEGGPGFKRSLPNEGKDITHDDDVNFSGVYPTIIDKDYDIKPEWNYEPYPNHRFLSGDLVMMGKSNTSIIHSFNTHVEGDKRGLIAIETELDYIHNSQSLMAFDWLNSTPDQIQQFKAIQLEHLKYHIDSFTRTDKNRWLNSLGVRMIYGTKFNADRHLIYYASEKDGTGQYGNMQKSYDINFRDEGEGPMPTEEDLQRGIVQIGTEIQQQPINTELDYDQPNDDVQQVQADARGAINFDTAVATLYAEFEEIALISRNGGDIVHAVLGEPLIRWMQQMMINQMHMVRTADILRDELHRLSTEFLQHTHAIVPGQTLAPLGSPLAGNDPFLTDYTYYWQGTTGDVGGDTPTFSEVGDYSPVSNVVKDRISEERSKLEDLIKSSSSLLSRNFKLN